MASSYWKTLNTKENLAKITWLNTKNKSKSGELFFRVWSKFGQNFKNLWKKILLLTFCFGSNFTPVRQGKNKGWPWTQQHVTRTVIKKNAAKAKNGWVWSKFCLQIFLSCYSIRQIRLGGDYSFLSLFCRWSWLARSGQRSYHRGTLYDANLLNGPLILVSLVLK
jgi:hypothetical protein